MLCKKLVKVTEFAHVHVLHYSEWCVSLCLVGDMRSGAILNVMISWWSFDGSMRKVGMEMSLPAVLLYSLQQPLL